MNYDSTTPSLGASGAFGLFGAYLAGWPEMKLPSVNLDQVASLRDCLDLFCS